MATAAFRFAGRRWGWCLQMALLLWGALLPWSSAAEERPRLELGGLLYYENYTYGAKPPGAAVEARNEITLRPRIAWSPSDKLDGTASVEIREDVSDPRRSRIYLHEAYLNVYYPRWSVTVGRQFISWGRADTLRPTDLFSRRDYTDIVERREEAVIAAKGDVDLGLGVLSVVWSPIFEGDILPLYPGSRWFLLPRSKVVPDVGTLATAYQFEPAAQPVGDLGSSQLGARLSGESGGVDYALMLAWTFDRIPTYFEQRSATPNPVDGTVDVHLVPHYRRLRVIGADFATVLEGVGLRGEAAYTLTDSWNSADDRIDDPYLRAVMGLDHTWDLSAANQLFVIVQYALDVEVPRRGVPNQEAPAELVRFRHFYRHALLVNAELRIGEFVRPGLKAMVNLEKGDFLIQPELSWQALDGLRVVVGADVLGGGRQTFFGQFDRNSRVRLRLEGRF